MRNICSMKCGKWVAFHASMQWLVSTLLELKWKSIVTFFLHWQLEKVLRRRNTSDPEHEHVATIWKQWPPTATARPLPWRPKKCRRRAEGEPQPRTRVQSSMKRCKNCNAFGHNRRTCTTAAASLNQAVRGRGRGSGRVGSRGIIGGRRKGATELQPHKKIAISQPDLFATPESQN